MLGRDVAHDLRTTPGPSDPSDRRIRRTWLLFAGTFFAMGLVMLLRIVSDRSRPIDFVLAGLLVVVGYAAILHRTAVQARESGRRAEAEGFARILSGLSRAFLDQRGMHEVLLAEAPDGFIVQGLIMSGASGSGTWSESLGNQVKET